MIFPLVVLLSPYAFGISPLRSSIEKHSESFFKFPRIRQITQQMRSSAAISASALEDRGLNLAGEIRRSNSPKLTSNDLVRAQGVYPITQSNLTSSLTFGLRNAGYLNSTQLELRSGWFSRDFQKLDSSFNTIDSFRDYSASLSYDVIKGGYTDPLYLNNRSTQQLQFSNLMSSTEQLVRSFLEYRSLLLDLYASYCKLKTSNNDLEILKRTEKEIKLSYQLKSTTYKQYLNVVDTVNFIERNNINYELNFKTNLQRLIFWSETDLEAWEKDFIANTNCPANTSEFSAFSSDRIEGLPSYKETILNLQTKAAAESAAYNYHSVKQQMRPSIRPFVEVGEEDSAGYKNQKISVGVNFNWDTPSQKTKAEVLGAFYSSEAAQIGNLSNERQFTSQMSTLKITYERTKKLLNMTIQSLENSNSLIKLLEVQKSIGQVDSLALSNAFTQRNQILSTMFDSLVNLEKAHQEIYYAKNWKELTNKAGISLK